MVMVPGRGRCGRASGFGGPPGAKPDLVVSAFTAGSVTVRNQGLGNAGPFRLRASGAGREQVVTFDGLAGGQTVTRELGLSCEFAYTAEADDLQQVEETDETNNSRPSQPVIC